MKYKRKDKITSGSKKIPRLCLTNTKRRMKSSGTKLIGYKLSRLADLLILEKMTTMTKSVLPRAVKLKRYKKR